MITERPMAILLPALMFAALNTVVYADPAAPQDNPPPAVAPAPPAGQPAPPPTDGAAPPTTEPTAPPAPAQPPGLLLRLKFKKGEVFVYQVSSTTSGVISTAGRSIPMDSTTSMVMTQTVKGVRPDGAARLILGMHDFQVSVQGKTMPMNAKMKSILSGNSELMDTQGNLVMDINGANPMASMFSSGGAPGGLSAYAFPDGPVHVGDTWTKQTNLSSAGLTMNTTYTLDNAWLENGRQFVAIHASATGTMAMQPTPQIPMNMTGPTTSISDIIFDETSGVVRQVKGTATLQMTMSYNMPNLQGGGGSTPQTMADQTTYSTTMQLVRVQQP